MWGNQPGGGLLLQLRHDERDGVSTHRRLDCFLNRLLRWRSTTTLQFCVTRLYARNSPVTGEFPAQRASNAKIFPFDDVIMMSKWMNRFTELSWGKYDGRTLCTCPLAVRVVLWQTSHTCCVHFNFPHLTCKVGTFYFVWHFEMWNHLHVVKARFVVYNSSYERIILLFPLLLLFYRISFLAIVLTNRLPSGSRDTN